MHCEHFLYGIRCHCRRTRTNRITRSQSGLYDTYQPRGVTQCSYTDYSVLGKTWKRNYSPTSDIGHKLNAFLGYLLTLTYNICTGRGVLFSSDAAPGALTLLRGTGRSLQPLRETTQSLSPCLKATSPTALYVPSTNTWNKLLFLQRSEPGQVPTSPARPGFPWHVGREGSWDLL